MNQSESRDSAGQSADLRTRIAAVLGDCYEKYGVDDYNLMADAVIRELGLHRESDNHHGDGTKLRHRYVTEWEADE